MTDIKKMSMKELGILLASGIKGEEYKRVMDEYQERRRKFEEWERSNL